MTATHHNGDIFQEILKRHPGQKAIIASGFSESQRVLEAQRLGAGRYIRKPYRMEQIGMALQEQLTGEPTEIPLQQSTRVCIVCPEQNSTVKDIERQQVMPLAVCN